MKRISLAIAALLVSATAVNAQYIGKVKREIRPFAGATIPTGPQRDLYTDAGLLGVQLALEVKPTLHVVGTFGWSPSQNRYAVPDHNVSIFTYDVGLEFDLVEEIGGRWEWKPFVGIGGGGRTYAFAGSALPDQTCFSGYGSIGTEFQIAPWAFRVEGRDNLFCYRSPFAGVKSQTRNDVGLSLGLAYHFR